MFLLVNNETSNLSLVYVYIFIAMIFCWTFVAPLAAVTVNVIRPSLRSLAGGLAHLIVSILGNIISPPLVGAISDESGSLKTAMQSVWITTLMAGVCWFIGYYVLPPLADMSGNKDSEGPPQDALSFTDFLFHGGIAAPHRHVSEKTSDAVANPMGDYNALEAGKEDNDETVVDNSKYMTNASKLALSARRASYAVAERNSEQAVNPMHGGAMPAAAEGNKAKSKKDKSYTNFSVEK
jgi:hypothetical protein